MTKMMKKALVIGTSEWNRAANIFATDGSFPKMRSTRQQRKRRMKRTGISATDRLTIDRETMATSKRLHPLRRKGKSQFANALRSSSVVNASVRKRSILEKVTSCALPTFLATLSCASVMLIAKFCQHCSVSGKCENSELHSLLNTIYIYIDNLSIYIHIYYQNNE